MVYGKIQTILTLILEQVLGGDEVVSIYDSRLLFLPMKKKLLVVLNTKIPSQGVDPGCVVLFDDVQHYSLNPLDDAEFTTQNKSNLKSGVIFKVKDDTTLPSERISIFLLRVFPSNVVLIHASNFKILDTHFMLR